MFTLVKQVWPGYWGKEGWQVYKTPVLWLSEVEDLQISSALTAFLVRVEIFLEICFSAFLFRALKSIEEIPALVLFALSVFYTGFGLVFFFKWWKLSD